MLKTDTGPLSAAISEARRHFEEYTQAGLQADGYSVLAGCEALRQWEIAALELERGTPPRRAPINEAIARAVEDLHAADEAMTTARRTLIEPGFVDPDGSVASALDAAIGRLQSARRLVARPGGECAA